MSENSNQPDSQLSESDRLVIHRVGEKINGIGQALVRVMPEESEAIVGTVAHDIGDFWEIAEKHRMRVEEILKLRGPEDRARLAEMLTEMFYGDVKAHLPNHIESMEEVLPGLIEKLELKS